MSFPFCCMCSCVCTTLRKPVAIHYFYCKNKCRVSHCYNLLNLAHKCFSWRDFWNIWNSLGFPLVRLLPNDEFSCSQLISCFSVVGISGTVPLWTKISTCPHKSLLLQKKNLLSPVFMVCKKALLPSLSVTNAIGFFKKYLGSSCLSFLLIFVSWQGKVPDLGMIVWEVVVDKKQIEVLPAPTWLCQVWQSVCPFCYS